MACWSTSAPFLRSIHPWKTNMKMKKQPWMSRYIYIYMIYISYFKDSSGTFLQLPNINQFFGFRWVTFLFPPCVKKTVKITKKWNAEKQEAKRHSWSEDDSERVGTFFSIQHWPMTHGRLIHGNEHISHLGFQPIIMVHNHGNSAFSGFNPSYLKYARQFGWWEWKFHRVHV